MTDLFSDPDVGSEHGQNRSQSRAERKQRAKRKAQRRRTLFTFAVMVLSLAVLVVGAITLVRPLLDGPEEPEPTTAADYPGPGSGTTTVVVNSGDSGATIGAALVEADVVASVDAFVAAYNANPDASGIQPGTYTLTMQIPAREALAALLDPANRTGGITIPEGWRATQIYDEVAEVLQVDLAEVEAAAEQVELPPEADGEIEGWLFPSTYTPGEDATPQAVLQHMVDQTVAVLERNEIPRDAWHDVIIKASIIEREVSRDEDRPNVAQVIENRLEYCNGSGRLEMDSTLVYELGKPGNELTQSDLNTPTPYNTHEIAGLPPTAISSPGEDSILAAANPPEGDYCYFVTVNLDTGETKFTGDYDEFLQFKEEYQEWLASRDEG